MSLSGMVKVHPGDPKDFERHKTAATASFFWLQCEAAQVSRQTCCVETAARVLISIYSFGGLLSPVHCTLFRVAVLSVTQKPRREHN